MENVKRNPVIDVIKGLGIILMVMGHSEFPFTRFIYLFHMAIFFMASGFCFKSESSDNLHNLLKFLKRRFFTLWFPYVVWTAVFSLLHNAFISLNIYTDNSLIYNYINGRGGYAEFWSIKYIIKNICMSLFLSGGTRMGGALWFICILMKISLLYVLCDFLIKHIRINTMLAQGILSFIFLCVGFYLSIQGISFLSLDKVFSYYSLFYIGFLLKLFNICDYFYFCKKHIIIFLGAFIILLVSNNFGYVELADTYYTNPLFLIIVSFFGWLFIYELSFFLLKVVPRVTNVIIIIGQNTLAVVILHFLCFKIINFIGIRLTEAPDYVLACYPIYMNNGIWWLAYSIVGVGIPVFISMIYKHAKEKLNYKLGRNK